MKLKILKNKLTGETLTEAVINALRERLERELCLRAHGQDRRAVSEAVAGERSESCLKTTVTTGADQ
jgi:hypothetical protein